MLASSLNCYIIRSPEIDTGVPLLHPETLEEVFLCGDDKSSGKEGLSSIAAKKGVYETTASRAILQVPCYFIPPVLTSTVFAATLTANPALTIPLTTYLLLVSFGFGLPFAIAVFPQFGEIGVEDVEEKFRQTKATDAEGKKITKFKYDKGL